MSNLTKTITYVLIGSVILFLIGFLLKSSLYIGAVILGVYLVYKLYSIIKEWIEEKNNSIKKKKFEKELESMKENRNTITFMDAEIVRDPVKVKNDYNENCDKVIDVEYKDLDE